MVPERGTPRNAIIGFAECMRHELHGKRGSDRYHDYTKDIHQSGRHLLEIINDILDLAKVEAGKIDLRHHPVRLDELFASCSRLMDERAVSSGVTLVIEPPDDVPVLLGDETRLRQILLNRSEEHTSELQ